MLIAAVALSVVAGLPSILGSAGSLLTPASTTTSYGVWNDSVVPEVPAAEDDSNMTLGVEFSSARAGAIKGIQYYGTAANTGPHTGQLWGPRGALLASVKFPSHSSTGWRTAHFTKPVKVRAGVRYIASYHAPRGHYAIDQHSLGGGKTVTTRDLTAFRGTYIAGHGRPTRTWNDSNYFVDVVFTPRVATPTTTPTATATATAEPTPTPTPTPTATATATSTAEPTPTPTPTPTHEPTPTPEPSPTPDATGAPKPADFPTRASVGPTTEPTQTYQGDCYFGASESGLVVENRIVNCADTGIRFAKDASGIVFRNSVIKGQLLTGQTPGDPEADDLNRPITFTVEDSRIVQSSTGESQDRAVCCSHFVVRRSLIQGTHSGLWAYNKATLVGNVITTDGTDSHSSGLRMLKNSVLRGNTITCEAVTPGYDGGCSAHSVFYREFGVTSNLTIEGNYFKRDPDGGPWFATRFAGCDTSNDCVNITVTGNLFDLGQGTDGGEFPNDAGDVWSDNWWTDGVPALSGQSRSAS